jgi:hypothetical protein
VGGPGNSTLSFDKRDLEKEIDKVMAGATYKNAMPVKYEFYDMAGNVVGSNSATDTFAVRQCTPGKKDPRLESVFVTFNVGGDGKDHDSNFSLLLWPGNYDISPSKQYGDMVFQYQQALDEGGTTEYYPNASYTVEMERVNKLATLSQFTKNGGQMLFSLFPVGNDTWQNGGIEVTLNFEGMPPKKVSFENITIDQDGRHRMLYFDGTFHAR